MVRCTPQTSNRFTPLSHQESKVMFRVIAHPTSSYSSLSSQIKRTITSSQIMIFRVSDKHTQLKPVCTIMQQSQMAFLMALSLPPQPGRPYKLSYSWRGSGSTLQRQTTNRSAVFRNGQARACKPERSSESRSLVLLYKEEEEMRSSVSCARDARLIGTILEISAQSSSEDSIFASKCYHEI